MEELSADDRKTVDRARRMQQYFSQPFFVAETFTGLEGRYVPLDATLNGFEALLRAANWTNIRSLPSLWSAPSMKSAKRHAHRGQFNG